MRVVSLLMKKLLTALAKSILIPLRLTVTILVTHAAIQKINRLDIKHLEEPKLLNKRCLQFNWKWSIRKIDGFLGMLLAALGASQSGNMELIKLVMNYKSCCLILQINLKY